ncbi:MAG: L,D-transpeptidase [Deltaproteobacteria bacterium]|nr:L,D-transpeptidase [Deltaproteobacteria bacterium]
MESEVQPFAWPSDLPSRRLPPAAFLGAVKIPFAADGVIALHGGGDRRVLGKPISAGCVRATDADLLRVVAWLDRRDALAAARRAQNGEFHRRFRRPIELVVR